MTEPDHEQPFGEPLTHTWRLEHVRQADQCLAGIDEALTALANLDEEQSVDPTDMAIIAALTARAQAGYAAANVRAQYVAPMSESDVDALNLLSNIGIGPATREMYEATLKQYGPAVAEPLRPRDADGAAG